MTSFLSKEEVLGPSHWICPEKARNFGSSDPETEVLGRLYLQDKDIATQLGIAEKDLQVHMENLHTKFTVSTRLGVIANASALGIVGIGSPPDPGDDGDPMAGSLVPRNPLPSRWESAVALPLPRKEEQADG